MNGSDRVCMCIDLKSYYASVECVHRGLDPLRANLLVADTSRTDQTICLAVSPALKEKGVPGRPRLFEAKQAIRKYERERGTKVDYIVAVPRMAEYERVSAEIYSVYLKYVSSEDIHVYSIDECFIDCTSYLHMYEKDAKKLGIHPARLMAVTMIRDVLKTTGITATVGIGTNLYLAKVAMDIVAKKAPADSNGVRIAELNEDSFKILLWSHRPLTDFWQIGPGTARKLESDFMFTMGDVAARSRYDEEFFYKTFGIDAEILIDHAWGIEPVTMREIKSYKSESHSLSHSQILPRPYTYSEAGLVFHEMMELLCTEMFSKGLAAQCFSWAVAYDRKSLDAVPDYGGPVCIDFYGRLSPKGSKGTIKMSVPMNNINLVVGQAVRQFDDRTDHRLLFRRLSVSADNVIEDTGAFQLNMFFDYGARERERHLMGAMLDVRRKYGPNAVFRGMSLLEGATVLERNMQIGGHRA